MFVPVTQAEFEILKTAEISNGTADAGIDELIGTKEEVPTGTGNSMQPKGKTRAAKMNEDEMFDILPDGEIVERS
jgi:hypothetical protein